MEDLINNLSVQVGYPFQLLNPQQPPLLATPHRPSPPPRQLGVSRLPSPPMKRITRPPMPGLPDHTQPRAQRAVLVFWLALVLLEVGGSVLAILVAFKIGQGAGWGTVLIVGGLFGWLAKGIRDEGKGGS